MTSLGKRFWVGFLLGTLWAILILGAFWVAFRNSNATGCQPGYEIGVTGGIAQADGTVVPVYACVADMRLEA